METRLVHPQGAQISQQSHTACILLAKKQLIQHIARLLLKNFYSVAKYIPFGGDCQALFFSAAATPKSPASEVMTIWITCRALVSTSSMAGLKAKI